MNAGGPAWRDAGQSDLPVTLLAHLTKPRPVVVQALRDVSRFAPHPSPRKQAYRTTGVITEMGVGRISYVDRVCPGEVSKGWEPYRKSEFSELGIRIGPTLWITV